MTDDELMDFDRDRLADFDEGQARELLQVQPYLYRNHLTIAKWIDGWRERMDETIGTGEEFQKGFDRGVGEIAAHLRQGDLVPGSTLLELMDGAGELDDSELLTAQELALVDELHAIKLRLLDLTSPQSGLLTDVVGIDIAIRGLQRMVMAQAGARRYPGHLPLLEEDYRDDDR